MNHRFGFWGGVAALALVAAVPSFGATTYSLTWDAGKYTTKSLSQDGVTVTYRAYEGIVYVANPVDTKYQSLNVYIPTEYFEGKTKGGYTAATAPLFFPNSVGGYMPGAAGSPGVGRDGKANAAFVALTKGLVVAEPGARGRTLQDASGAYYGKAPAAIVDLKAAVRYLRFNDKAMPGNAERIVSDGTSAGGALSALLGATGNSKDYEPYLKALGAAEARDDIWAVAAYCPITNLDNADSAYEWWLGTLKAAGQGQATQGGQGMQGPPQGASGPFTAAQLTQSAQLKALFPTYLNSLKLKAAGTALTLASDGTGSFATYLKGVLLASAQTALAAGTDLSELTWVTVKNGKVTDLDLAGYLTYIGRKKGVPSFDALDATSGENNLFGTATVNNLHFTAYGQANDTAKAGSAEAAVVKLMNPMGSIGAAGVTTSPYWRIRHGSLDTDTALAIPALLALKLSNAGVQVDFAAPWGVPHSGDYDLDQLFSWVAQVTK